MKVGNSLTADDRGVSPVIGVILMVAITVILAAIIGTFVLGLGENIQSEVNAGVTVSGTDASSDRTVTYTAKGTSTNVNVTDNDDFSVTLDNVGNSTTISDSGNYSVIALNDDGGETVVRTFEVA